MRSELILTAVAHTNCQCRQTMQRLHVAGMDAGECATMARIHRAQQNELGEALAAPALPDTAPMAN